MEVIIIPMSIICFLLFGYDKMQARVDGRRIPEKVLLGLGILGGAVGGLLGMQVFRHKTRHAYFWVVLGAAAVLQVGYVIFISPKLA